MKELIHVPTELTKQSIKSVAREIIDSVNSGDIEAMRVHLQLRVYEDIIKDVKAGIKDAVISDASKYINDGSFPAKVVLTQAGDRIDFEHDAEYRDIKAALKSREEKLKAAYKNGAPVIDRETGELVPVCPAKSESEVTVKIEFKK